MTFGLGECTPTPTVTTGADGQPRVVYAGCPTTIDTVLPDGTNVFYDTATGQYTVPPSGMSTMTLALIAAGVVALVALSKR